MKRISVLAFATLVMAASGQGQDAAPALLDLAATSYKAPEVVAKDKTKTPGGSTELVAGKSGQARRFSFDAAKGQQFFTAWVNPKEDWNAFDGFSFWVKGDGSKNWGGLQFVDGADYGLRYGYCFSIESTEWVKITVPWSDLTPELAGPLVGVGADGYAPGKFRNLWFGKWFYWQSWPACSYAIDHVALEKKIARDTTDYTPAEPGVARFLAKLKAKKPVTIVTMGDSLSDKHHWANKEKLWSEELVRKLKAAYGCDGTLVNPAIGGTTLSQNTVLIPRWASESPSPDLVTICFGFNDWDSKVRGPRFREYLELAIDRVRRATKGRADILVMTTLPAFARWETFDELCRAECEVARERKTGLADTARAFHAAGSPDEALKRQYWAWDKVHLGGPGHDLFAATVFAAIQCGGLDDLKASTNAFYNNQAQ